jgi:hypothetical protein
MSKMKSSHSSNERKVIGSDIQRLIENYMTFPAAHRAGILAAGPAPEVITRERLHELYGAELIEIGARQEVAYLPV